MDDIDLDRRLSTVLTAGNDPAPTAADLAASLSGRRARRRRRRALGRVGVGIGLLVLLVGTVSLGWSANRREELVMGPATQPSATPSADAVFGWEPGWHDLDPGPLPAGSGSTLVWTGAEVVVLGGGDGAGGGRFAAAVYDPAARTWRMLDVPDMAATGLRATWTGTEVVIRTHEADPALQGWLTWNPATDQWRTKADLPAPVIPITSNMASGYPLVWTGHVVLDTSAWITFDPATGANRPMAPMPFSTFGLGYSATWTGSSLLVAEFGRGQAATYDPTQDTWTVVAPPPTLGMGGLIPAAEWDGTEVLRLDFMGQGDAFRPADGTWRTLPVPDGSGVKCDSKVAMVAALATFDQCFSIVQWNGAGWSPVESPANSDDGEGIQRQIVSTGDALVTLFSTADTLNVPNAPITRFRIWVPGGDTPPSTAPGSTTPVTTGTVPSPPGTQPGPVDEATAPLTLYVSNQSFEDPTVKITVKIDGEVVVDEPFAVEGQHNWRMFELTLPPGEHRIEVVSDTGATLDTVFTTQPDMPLWGVLDYWWYPTDGEGRHFTFTPSDTPVAFA